MQVDLPLTAPQREFVLSRDECPAIIGGLGSGKSRAGTIRLILLLLEEKGLNGGYYMPTYDLLRLRAIPGVEEDLEMLGLPYTTNRSEYSIVIHGYGMIIFRSYDRPERIVAYETAHSVVDELDTLPKEKAALVWRKISERNRQKCKRGNSKAVVTTPDQGFNGFIYQKWVKMRQAGYAMIKAPTASNPYLPDDYIEQIRANYDPLLADMYLNGEFVSLNDKKVYHFFSRERHHSDRTIQQGERLCVSIDFNIGGCCATAWVIDSNMPIAVDEFVSHDTQDFINNLASRYRGHKLIIYPDASGGANRTNAAASDIELIKNAGYAVDAPDSNPLVRDRINAYNALFAHDRIKVNTNKCPELTNALEVQGYTDKGEPEKFNEHPAVDDWVDSSGYFINRRFSVKAPMAAGVRFGR
jgi:phage terminase large subunit